MTRPKWYDDQVIAYSKLLKKKISKYGDMFDKEAFFQDVMITHLSIGKNTSLNIHSGRGWALLQEYFVRKQAGVTHAKRTIQNRGIDRRCFCVSRSKSAPHHRLKQTIDLIPKTRNGRIFLSTANEEVAGRLQKSLD